jgi:hypothetical protein
VENGSDTPVILEVTPWMQLASKGNAPQKPYRIYFGSKKVTGNGLYAHIKTNGTWEKFPTAWQRLHYAYDVKDGRPESGLVAAGGKVTITVDAGKRNNWKFCFLTRVFAPPVKSSLPSKAKG